MDGEKLPRWLGSISATIVDVIAFERPVGLAFKRQYGRVSND
jgi:hypothetical protein